LEWFLIWLFICIENVSKALSLGWLVFWFGMLLICIAVVAAATKADAWGSQHDFGHYWENYKFTTMLKPIGKKLVIGGFIVGMVGMLLPSAKQMALIVGTGVTYQAVTSETGQRIGGKVSQLLEQKIDEALNSGKEEEGQKEVPSTKSGSEVSTKAT
jgi:RsiW-degrading membrane proteinase PrsW (M82 family)